MKDKMMIIEENESNVRSYVRNFPVVFDKAFGSFIYEDCGKRYIDFFSGAGGLNYGHNNASIIEPMVKYLKNNGVLHSLDMATNAKIKFIDAFVKYILLPRNLDYKIQFTGPTGTNAIEAALKLARSVTGRSNIISFSHAYHGLSLGSLSATSSTYFREVSGVDLNNVTFMPFDGYIQGLDSAKYFEQVIKDPSSGIEKPAAVILETIQCEGGINIASKQWLQSIEKICRDNEILLIVDDIQVGCGRAGTFFSFEDSGIRPDIVALSKSISGSGLPMSIILIKPEYDIWKPAQHNGTFRGNDLAFISATAAIETFWMDDNLSKEVQRKGDIVRGRLLGMTNDNIGIKTMIRGIGLVNGIAFYDPKNATVVRNEAFRNGLIIELCGANDEVAKIMPSLCIDDKTLGLGLDIIENIIKTL